MVILCASSSFNIDQVQGDLAKRLPDVEVLLWPHPRANEADVVVGWNVSPDLYDGMKRLKMVQSIGAGADSVLRPGLPREVPVCRIVDEGHAVGMLEFVQWGVLYFQREFDVMARNQRDKAWKRFPQTNAKSVTVGVLGLGHMGLTVAKGLARAGYNVRGWSRTPKDDPAVRCYAGREQLHAFASGCNTLVCLLPLTQETRGILDRELFAALPMGSSLVQCGRSEHLVEADFREALDSGRLRGALMDVFAREPLPPENWMWSDPRIVVTPHVASEVDWSDAMDLIADNITRVARGEAPLHSIAR